jgi:tRNA (Thr-GGU) A37 N-methylase
LAKILQILYLTGKIPYLPIILLQKPGGYEVLIMSNNGIKELKKRFYRMNEFNAMTPGAKTQLLRKENGLDILDLYVTRNTTVEKPTTAWEKVEVLLLESINEDCKKQSEEFIRKNIASDNELKGILATRSEDKNQQIVQCLSKISQAKPNPSVGIAQVQVEGSPFGDIDPHAPDIRKNFTENNQEQLSTMLEESRRTLFQEIFKGYKGTKVIKINAAMNNLFNRSLHNGQLTNSLTFHISIAHYIDNPELISSNQKFNERVTIAREEYENGMDYLEAKVEVKDFLFNSDRM